MADTEVTSGGEITLDSQEQQFFSTPEITQRLDLLRHLTDNSERILVLRGGAGSGKSTLFQRYQQGARDEWVLCPVISNPMLHPEQLFSLLGNCFGVQGEDGGSMDLLLEQFENLQELGSLPVIVIDDAHLLPLSTIIALLRLFEHRRGDRALVRIILFALPQIDDLLHTPQIQAMNLQVLQMLELPVLTRQQMGEFINFISGGPEVSGAFDNAEVDRIAEISGGVPGVIEEQVTALLRARAATEKSADSSSSSEEVGSAPLRLSTPALLGGAGLGVLIIFALLFQDGINRLFEGGDEPMQAQQRSSDIVLDLPQQAAKPVEPIPVVPVESPAVEVVSPPEAEPVMIELAEVAATPINVEESAPEPMLEIAEAPVGSRMNLSQASSDESADLYNIEDIRLEIPVESRVERVPEPEAGPVVTPSPALKAAPDAAAVVDIAESKSQPVPAAKAVAIEVSQQGRPLPSAERREAWLQVQNPSAYTLQLVGVQSEQAADTFVSRHKLAAASAIFKTEREGGAWFSVVYGVYADRDAAVAAREKLSAGLRRNAVWPRSFASIQQAIAK
ncbi:MAG: AAA family ATPase [Sedimenticola sp.]